MPGNGVKLFVALNRALGLAPFDMSVAVMAPKAASYTSSITLRLYQMVPTYTALCFYVLCLGSIFWQRQTGSSINSSANWVQFVPNALCYMVCLFVAIRNRAVTERILGTFYSCDQLMQDHLGVSFVQYNRKANYMSYASAGLAIVAGVGISTLAYVNSVDWGQVWTVLYWLAFCIPKFSVLLVNLQFASCLYYVVSRIQLLRRNLSSCFLHESVLISSLTPDDLFLALPGNKVSPVAGGKRRTQSREALLKHCSALLRVTTTLQRLVDLINAHFGKQLVMSLMSAFVCVTVQLHHTIRLIRQPQWAEGTELVVTFNASLIALHALEILVIFGSGDRAKVKWAELIAEVQRVRQQVGDEEARVQLFDVINGMCLKKVEFQGCNMFTIDLSVITGLISSVATYLIVLVQFQINDENSGHYQVEDNSASFGAQG